MCFYSPYIQFFCLLVFFFVTTEVGVFVYACLFMSYFLRHRRQKFAEQYKSSMCICSIYRYITEFRIYAEVDRDLLKHTLIRVVLCLRHTKNASQTWFACPANQDRCSDFRLSLIPLGNEQLETVIWHHSPPISEHMTPI